MGINMKEEIIKEVLDLLSTLEKSVGKMYLAASVCFPLDKDFFEKLAVEESRHSLYVKRLKKIYADHPDEFYTEFELKPEAIEFVIKGVKERTDEIRDNKLTLLRFLSIAIDLENSLAEAKFQHFLRADSNKYNKIVADISSETFEHRKHLKEKRDEAKKEISELELPETR